MAIDPGSDRRRERVTSFAAVAVVAASTALAFARVFEGGGAGWKLLLTALASATIATLLERRGLVLATGVALVVLGVLATWLVFPDTLRWGLPTGASLDAALDALGDVGSQARAQVSPTAPNPPLLLAAVTAVFAAVFSMHALAIRAGSPLLALAPPVALITFADSALDGDGTVGLALLFLAGALGVLVADGVRRVRRWGLVRPWGSGHAAGLVPRGAGRVAAGCVLAALLLPGALPGFNAVALLDVSTGSGDEPVIDPLVSIGASLNRDEPLELLRVEVPNEDDEATYLRMLALDEFDGNTWTTDDYQAEGGTTVTSGSDMRPGLASSMTQRVEIRADLRVRWIPVPFEPTTIALDNAPTFSFDPELTIAVAPEPLEEGSTYTVAAHSDPPTAPDLDAVDFGSRDSSRADTRLPETLPPEINGIAERWAADEETPYRQVLAIQRHLQKFHYDKTVPARADGDALLQFLTVTKSGFCQQFAGAMAVLVRSLGYPARVAVGFTQGEPLGPTTHLVSTDHTHAWVEVYFPGYGWLAFEPTPDRSNPQAASYVDAGPGNCALRPEGCGGEGAETPKEGRVDRGGLRGSELPRRRVRELVTRPIRAPGGPGLEPVPTPALVPLRPLILVLLAAAVLLALLIPPVKAIRRRAHLARGREPRALVLAAYDVFDARAQDLGLGRRHGETVEEHRVRLSAAAPASASRLERLTGAVTKAAYGPTGPGDREAREAKHDAGTAIHDLRRTRAPVRRLTGLYRRGL